MCTLRALLFQHQADIRSSQRENPVIERWRDFLFGRTDSYANRTILINNRTVFYLNRTFLGKNRTVSSEASWILMAPLMPAVSSIDTGIVTANDSAFAADF